jgi:hypothetical protein
MFPPLEQFRPAAAAQAKDTGTLYWKIPTDISGGYTDINVAHMLLW